MCQPYLRVPESRAHVFRHIGLHLTDAGQALHAGEVLLRPVALGQIGIVLEKTVIIGVRVIHGPEPVVVFM